MEVIECTFCKLLKAEHEFSKRGDVKKGVKSWCRDCFNKKAKEYYQNNRSNRLEYHKLHRELNKERLNEKVTCECGGSYTSHDASKKTRHGQTKKHVEYMKTTII